MNATAPPDFRHPLVEDLARVVASEAELAWFEPEQGGSCAGCAAMAGCGAQDIGSLARRLAARRFSLPQPDAGPRFAVGERVVVGVAAPTLVGGSAIAYMLPLLTLFAAGFVAQNVDGRDGVTLLASVAGLLVGVGLAALVARRMSARGALSLHFLRRADPGSACIPSGGASS
jgi:sigma-E factor negative regulatory protein RseC